MDFVGNFAPGSAIRRQFEIANEWFGGGTSFTVIVEGKKPGTFLDLQNLRALFNPGRWLEEPAEVGDTTSLAKVLGYTRLAFRETEAGKKPLPRSRVVIEQLVGHIEREDLAPLVDAEYRRATILVRSRVGSSAEMARLLDRMAERLENLPPPLVAKATGGAVLLSRAFDAVSRSQSQSLGLALAAIFAILAIHLRSARLGALVLVPNAIPVLFCFGLLGWTGVSLNNSTALLACLILGITVDDSVHYLADPVRRDGGQSVARYRIKRSRVARTSSPRSSRSA